MDKKNFMSLILEENHRNISKKYNEISNRFKGPIRIDFGIEVLQDKYI